jgi:hypothetical protein
MSARTNALLIAAVLVAFSCDVSGDQNVRISIPDLLNPETRLRAFQKFRSAMNPQESESGRWSNIQEFSKWHRDLHVSELKSGAEKPRYLVTWRHHLMDGWNDVEGIFKVPAPDSSVLLPQDFLQYWIFQADGSPTTKEDGAVFLGNIADMNGDGTPEILESIPSSTVPDIPGLGPVGTDPKASQRNGDPLSYEYLQVRPPEYNSTPQFAVLYNSHPSSREAGNTWGWHISDADRDGQREIQLGPVLAPAGIEPKVTLRWDREKEAWIGPEPKPGDHFRLIQGKKVDEEVNRIMKEGGLNYPLVPTPVVDAQAEELFLSVSHEAQIPADEISKPYAYHSLAGFSNEELFEFMSARPNVWDYVRKKNQSATKVTDLWRLDPQAAALTFARKNRPATAESRYLLSIVNPGNERPPEEGDLTLSDGPSGCFSPSGAYIHQLHCARQGSFVVFVSAVWYGGTLPITERRSELDFRKLELPYEQARHVLQTTWWLSRIRSRKISQQSSAMSGLSSTSDGFATVHFASKEREFTVTGIRYGSDSVLYPGVGQTSEEYDESAFINLVVRLLNDDFPASLGKAWDSLGTLSRWTERDDAPDPQSAEELERLKATAGELLGSFRVGTLRAAVASEVVHAAGQMGWKDLRDEIEGVASKLPALLEYEKQLAEMETRLAALRKKLGPKASDAGVRERQHPPVMPVGKSAGSPSDAPAIPGLYPFAREPLRRKKQDTNFAEFDALHEARSQLEFNTPQPQRDIAELRKAIPAVTTQLDEYDDADAILKHALKDESTVYFAVPRLVELDRARAIELLKHCERNAENVHLRDYYQKARQGLDPQRSRNVKAGSTLSDEKKKQLAILLNSNEEAVAREAALTFLVPEADPMKYRDPAIDAGLIKLLARSEFLDPRGLPLAAARRMGGKSWQPLMEYARGEQPLLFRLNRALPALNCVALAEPEPYRAELGKMLGSELKATNGFLDAILWSIWQLELRELAPDLERIATSGPKDYEGDMATTISSTRSPVAHRYHLARHILALWNEEDPLCRAKLVVAFGYANAIRLNEAKDGALEALRDRIRAQRGKLDDEQRNALKEFVEWCDATIAARLKYGTRARALATVRETVREALELGQ